MRYRSAEEKKERAEHLERAIKNSGLLEKNIPSDILDKVIEIIGTMYMSLMERLAKQIVEKMENGLNVENLIAETKKTKIEILYEPNVYGLYVYRPPERHPLELIIGRSGLERQFEDRDIPPYICNEVVKILKSVYEPLREKWARLVAEKLKDGLPIENLIEEAKKLRKAVLIYEKEKKLYIKNNKKYAGEERAALLKKMWGNNFSQDTTKAISSCFGPFFEIEKGFKGVIAAEEFAKRILELIDNGMQEKELIIVAKNIQHEMLENL